MAKVLYKYDAAAPDELSLPEGSLVTVINRQCEDEGWFIAEAPDGRRGLFPDNFVKFLPSESQNNIQSSSQVSHQPPSLPAKPQKFTAATHGHPQPVAFVRDSLFGDSTIKQPNMSSEAKTPTDSATDKLMTTSAISLSNDAENNNNISPTNVTTQNIISSNTPGNRHSMIAGMQRILFPGGKLPLQQPGSRNSTIISGGKLEPSANVEPKMTDFDNNLTNKQQNNNNKLSSSSIVTARTKIAPSNKRPPSKVNSAALLAANTRDSFNNNNDTAILEMSSPTSTTTTKTTQSSTSSPITATGGNNKTTSVFSASLGEETSQSQHRYIPLGERIGFQQPKTTLITSHVPSISLVPSLNTTTISSTKEIPTIPLSSSPESVISNITERTTGGGISLSHLQPSTSQWVSRVDFDRFAEECNRRFSEMDGELVDLRRRVEASQNK
uniref:SH3 domain-containing protein n=1 Tax=Meloidogyne hapla TaxID=6305 RepID=A0A1I8BD58_MELHA